MVKATLVNPHTIVDSPGNHGSLATPLAIVFIIIIITDTSLPQAIHVSYSYDWNYGYALEKIVILFMCYVGFCKSVPLFHTRFHTLVFYSLKLKFLDS